MESKDVTAENRKDRKVGFLATQSNIVHKMLLKAKEALHALLDCLCDCSCLVSDMNVNFVTFQ